MNAYGVDGMTSAECERAMGFDLSAEDAAVIQEGLEDMAREEAESFSPRFAEYLNDQEDWRGGPGTDVLRCVFVGVDAQWSGRIAMQRAAVLRDWIAYRTSVATEDERAAALGRV